MKTWKEKISKVVDDVLCDCCGKSTTNCDHVGPDYATLDSCWGYGSDHDGTMYDIHLCEKCFCEILSHIKENRRQILGPFKYPHENDPLQGTKYL